VTAEAAYLYDATGSVNAPRMTTSISLAHRIGNNVFVMGMEGGTMLNRNVGQPYRFTLGGPMRLSASVIDEYRGTDYFLVQPAVLRRIASLPQVLGQSIYVGAVYEAGQMRAPDASTITRQDVMVGVVAETPLGVISLGPALGDGGNHRLVFTLGRLF
jgi:NTE family protein